MLPAELSRLARAQHGAASSEQVLRHYQPNRVTRLVARGELVRLWRGAYVLPESASDLSSRLSAADLTLGRVIPALHTAAQLHGFDLTGDPRLHVLSTSGRQSRIPQIVAHRQQATRPLVELAGRMVLHPSETAIAVGCAARDGPHTLAALDAAARTGLTTRDLVDVANGMRRNGISRVRSLLAAVSSLSESPGESWLRWVILDAGLPPPELQHWVRISGDRWARLDLAWPDRKVACEYDGVAFHTGHHLHADRSRLNGLIALGWTVIHVTSPMVFAGRALLVAQVAALLR